MHNLAVPAGSENHHRRRLELIELEPRCKKVALHVINPDKRELSGPRRRLAKRKADQQRTYQARSLGGGHPVEIVGMDTRFGERPMRQRPDRFNMGPGGDLGDYTPNREWRSTCEESTLESGRVPRTTATAVSSQLVSKARTVGATVMRAHLGFLQGGRQIPVGRFHEPT